MTIKHPAKTAGLAAAMLLATSAVQAQPASDSFTFTTQSGDPTVVGGNAAVGNNYTGMYFDGTHQTVMSDGERRRGKFTCVAMTQPPHDKLFDMHMLCDATDSLGTYSVTLGCTTIDAATQHNSCIGGLFGKSGAYAGRRGTLTNYQLGSGATGTGQWFK